MWNDWAKHSVGLFHFKVELISAHTLIHNLAPILCRKVPHPPQIRCLDRLSSSSVVIGNNKRGQPAPLSSFAPLPPRNNIFRVFFILTFKQIQCNESDLFFSCILRRRRGENTGRMEAQALYLRGDLWEMDGLPLNWRSWLSLVSNNHCCKASHFKGW